jgi:hypothetical integral membrane protein (TIGR02206 family)
MGGLFAKDYPGDAFVLFGPSHLVAIGIMAAAIVFLGVRGRSFSPGAKRILRFGLAGILVANEIAWHVWTIATGQWSARTMLPLHLCSITCWLSIVGLLRPSQISFEYVYFLGITGAGHTVITPNIGPYGFPHIHFFLTLVGHAGIVVAAAYLTFVEGFRPTWKSLWRVFGWTNLYLVNIFLLNLGLGSNYMYVSHKPETPSLMDLMGPWPWYILALEGVALLHMLALYAPFAFAEARLRRGRVQILGISANPDPDR